MNSSGNAESTDQHQRVHAGGRLFLFTLLSTAAFVRVLALLSLSASLAGDPDGYAHLARNLWEYHSYGFYVDSDPSAPGDVVKPTAYRPPLYAIVIAPFVALSPENHIWVGGLQVVLGVATVWLVWRMAVRLGLSILAARIAGMLVAFDPILLNQQAQVMTETLAAFLVMVTWHALALAFDGEDSAALRWKWLAIAGAMLGLCMLCRPTFAAWLVLVLVATLFVHRGPRSNRFAAALLLLAGAAIVIAPWALRNRKQLQHTILATTHGGFTLLLANNPEFYEYLAHGAWGSVWTPGPAITELPGADWRDLTKQADFDEVAHDIQYNRQAWENIRAEPAQFAYACLVRLGRLWGILPHQLTEDESRERRLFRYAVALWYAIELPLAAFALWSLGRSLRRSPWIWGVLLLVSVSAMHLLYWTDLRMCAPVMPVVALLAARAVVVLAAGFRHPNPDTVKV